MAVAISVKSNYREVLREMRLLRSDITDKALVSSINRAGAATRTAAVRASRLHFASQGVRLLARHLRSKLLPLRRATRRRPGYVLGVVAGGIGKKGAGIPPKPPREFNVKNPTRNWPIFKRVGNKRRMTKGRYKYSDVLRQPLHKVTIATAPSLIKETSRAIVTRGATVFLSELRRQLVFRVRRGF